MDLLYEVGNQNVVQQSDVGHQKLVQQTDVVYQFVVMKNEVGFPNVAFQNVLTLQRVGHRMDFQYDVDWILCEPNQ